MKAVCRFRDESKDLLEPVVGYKISSAASHRAGCETRGGGGNETTNDCTIRRLRDVEGLESEPSRVACGFLFVLLCRGHLLSEAARGRAHR